MDCRAITILAALLTFAASGAEIRHEAFDGKLPADLDARQARFVKGVRGQAVVFDDIASGKRVPCMGCKLTAEKGSVSCWINLQDYRGSDPGCAIFFSADSPEGGRIILYKPQPKRLLFLYNLGRQVARIYSDIRNWQPGKWHHIAATWDHEVMLFYVDGNLVGGATRPAVGKGTLDNMALGTLKFPNESGHTAIDELRLYSEALTAAEVSRLYYADAGKSLLDVSAPLTFRVGASYGTISQDGEIGTHEYASVFPGGFNENGAAADVQAKWHFSATENGFCGAVRAPARFSSLAVTFIGADNRPRTVRFEAGKSLDRDGIRAVSEEYWAQVQCYMGYGGLDRAVWVVMNKDTCELYSERAHFAKSEFKALEEKAVRIINAKDKPPRGYPEGARECGRCGYAGHCASEDPYVQTTQTCGSCWYCEPENGHMFCRFPAHPNEITRWGECCLDWKFRQDIDRVPF